MVTGIADAIAFVQEKGRWLVSGLARENCCALKCVPCPGCDTQRAAGLRLRPVKTRFRKTEQISRCAKDTLSAAFQQPLGPGGNKLHAPR